MSKGFLSRGLTWDTKEWKVGYYANTRLNDDPPLSLSQCRKHHLIIDEGIMWYIDGSTRGLDTGLKDKNGTQIFEGDIINYYAGDEREHLLVVKWNALDACFDLGWVRTVYAVQGEVIGNVHQHSHLLEVPYEKR